MITSNNNILIGENGRATLLDYKYEATNQKLPVVVFCHGYKGFKDWGAWSLMGSAFAKAGFLFIKFNYSHNGGTVEEPIDFPDLDAFSKNNYSIEVRETKIVLDWIENTDLPVDKTKINLDDNEIGISPGQACVFYSKNTIGDKVLGGGWISKTVNKYLST